MRRDHELAHKFWSAVFVAAAVMSAALVVVGLIVTEG